MKKQTLIMVSCLMGLCFAAYLYASITKIDALGSILSAAGALGAGMVLLAVYIKSDKRRAESSIWLLFFVSVICWAAADVVWAVMDIGFNTDPSEDMVVMHLYAFTNLLMFAALGLFMANQLKRWNIAKLLLDAVMFAITSLLVVWILFFNRNVMLVDIIVQDGPLSVACIISDILIIVCVAVWFMSARSGKIPAFIRMLLGGAVLFSFTDLVYYYIAFNNIYVPNSLIDVVYIGALLLAGLGGLVYLYQRRDGMAETGNLPDSRRSRIFKEAAVLLAGHHDGDKRVCVV